MCLLIDSTLNYTKAVLEFLTYNLVEKQTSKYHTMYSLALEYMVSIIV